MSKLYNTYNDCSINFDEFFYKIDNSLSKNQRNFLGDFFSSLLFQVGLKLFQLAFNLSKYYRLPFTFKLYDI